MAKKKKKSKSKLRRRIGLIVKVSVLLLLLTILIGGLIFYFKYGKQIFAMQEDAIEMVADSTVDTFRGSETSIAYNSKGKQVAILKGEKDVYYLNYSDIPKWAIDAMVVTEDKKFYSHGGVDLLANVRAFWEYIQHKGEITQGASTITQQLARDVFLTQDVTFERKIKEIFVSLEIEKKYTKEQILEFYLNNIYFANGYYGIEAAAKGYFSKGASELTLGEICFLCAIPNNPSLYNPLRKFDNTIKRKNRILDQMLTDGVISKVEYDEAYNQEIKLNIKEVKTRNYIQTYITRCATRAIMQKNGFEFQNEFDSEEEKENYEEQYDEAYAAAQKELFNAGYRIYTSIDLSIQKKLQKAVNSNLSGFKEKNSEGYYEMQGAAVCIDNTDGRVVAIVGGRSQKTDGYTLNRAYQAYRQPGSSIKPLIVYTPSLERDYTANSLVNDRKTKDGPSNSDNRYLGTISLRTAVEYSKNTVAWQLFEELTPKIGLQYALNMNFNRIVDSDYYLPASLGGLTYGCSPVEMASGYATLANEGKFREPTCIIKILDANGNEVVSDDVDEKFIYESQAANVMVDILEGVLVRGTAKGYALPNGMACAGKTGTTNDKKDGWFCGFTPYYTTSVWVGYDQPKKVDDLYGSTYPLRTWYDFMSELHADLEPVKFPYEIIQEEQEAKEAARRAKEAAENPKPTPKPTETQKPKKTKAPVEETVEPEPTEQPMQPEDGAVEDPGDMSDSENDSDFSEDDTAYPDEQQAQ